MAGYNMPDGNNGGLDDDCSTDTPDSNLDAILELVRKQSAAGLTHREVRALCERISDLDDHLSVGGELPERWER